MILLFPCFEIELPDLKYKISRGWESAAVSSQDW